MESPVLQDLLIKMATGQVPHHLFEVIQEPSFVFSLFFFFSFQQKQLYSKLSYSSFVTTAKAKLRLN